MTGNGSDEKKPKYSATFQVHVVVFAAANIEVHAEQMDDGMHTDLQGTLRADITPQVSAMLAGAGPVNEQIAKAVQNFAAQMLSERLYGIILKEGRELQTETTPMQTVPDGGAKA